MFTKTLIVLISVAVSNDRVGDFAPQRGMEQNVVRPAGTKISAQTMSTRAVLVLGASAFRNLAVTIGAIHLNNAIKTALVILA